MKSIRLTAELIPEPEGGFSVYCPELDIYTQGDTETECLREWGGWKGYGLIEIRSPGDIVHILEAKK